MNSCKILAGIKHYTHLEPVLLYVQKCTSFFNRQSKTTPPVRENPGSATDIASHHLGLRKYFLWRVLYLLLVVLGISLPCFFSDGFSFLDCSLWKSQTRIMVPLLSTFDLSGTSDSSATVKVPESFLFCRLFSYSSFGFANCCSERNKGPLIADFVTAHSLDILAVAETHVKPSDSPNLIRSITPPGFKFIHKPRPVGHGSGVSLFINTSVACIYCLPGACSLKFIEEFMLLPFLILTYSRLA